MAKHQKQNDFLRKKIAQKIGQWILVIILLLTIGLYFVGPDRIYLFIDSFGRAERLAQAETEARLENLRLQAKLNEAKDKQDHIAAEQRLKQLEEEKKQKQLQLMERIEKDIKQDMEREAKWERYYQPKGVCAKPKVWEKKVECVNERLKARQRFDELYAAGKL